MFHSIVRAVALLSLVCAAQGARSGGNTSYRAEVAPLVSARPDLASRLRGYRVADVGNGTRIGVLRNARLAGHHVGPYEFSAVDEAGKTVTVKFRTRQRYVNGYGVVVAELFDGELTAGGSFGSATTVQEELVGITIAAN